MKGPVWGHTSLPYCFPLPTFGQLTVCEISRLAIIMSLRMTFMGPALHWCLIELCHNSYCLFYCYCFFISCDY